jgi:hypothetical protein
VASGVHDGPVTSTRQAVLLAAVAVGVAAVLTGGALAVAAGGTPTAIPDSVLLQPDDLAGAQPAEGGPAPEHPLPPQPCPDSPGATPLAARTVAVVYQPSGSGYRHQVYELVARYEPGVAAQVAEDLRDAITRCGTGPEGVRHRIVTDNRQGPHSMTLWREFNDGDRFDAYVVGVAGDYLVVTLDTGWGTAQGDLTTVSDLGARAIRRAGGDPSATSAPLPATSAPTHWSTSQADVTAVRRGPGGRTAIVELQVPSGDPDCARDPRATNLVEENNLVYASFVVDSRQDDRAGRCLARATATAELTAPGPLGDRTLVLNQQAWAPQGDTYRRCDDQLGCRPPADHCDRAWVDQAISGMDVPRHAYQGVKGCDGDWLVLEIDTGAGACGPVDPGPRPSCTAESRRSRHFMTFTDGWTTVSGARDAGCAGIHAVEPDFPTALCKDLPAL